MATAKKRSTKSTAASPKAAEKTASSRATKPGTKSAPATASGNKKAATQKAATQKPSAPAKATRSAKPAAPAKSAAPAARDAGKPGKAGADKSARAKVVDAVGKAAKAARKVAERVTAGKGRTSRAAAGEAALFAPLTDGERAEALRLLTEDQRLSGMANVGRYRVIAVEPLVAKSPPEVAAHRLARTVVYDYSSERSVDASIDLDTGKVVHLTVARTQPMLSRDEEAAAITIALADEQVKSKLAPGDGPQVAMHYWSRRDTSLAYSRRAAAVLLGQPRGATSLIAVVDLLDNLVCEIVPAAEW